MAIDFNTAPLGLAVQQGESERRAKIGQEEVTQQALEAGQQSVQKAIAERQKQIKITPQLAEGLSDVTGQDWKRMVGMTWDSQHLFGLVTGLTREKAMRDVAGIRAKTAEDVETKKLEGEKDIQTMKDTSAENVARTKGELEVEAARIRAKSTTEAARIKSEESASKDPQVLGEKLLSAINQATKSKDERTKVSAINNYNNFAKDHNLSLYIPEPGFFSGKVKVRRKSDHSMGKIKVNDFDPNVYELM